MAFDPKLQKEIVILCSDPGNDNVKDSVIEYLKQYGYTEDEINEKIDFNIVLNLPKIEVPVLPTITKADLKNQKLGMMKSTMASIRIRKDR